jgi:long-chain acyl-CoA synthetase
MEGSTATRRAVDAASLAEAFRIQSEARADQVAIRTKDDATTITWTQWRDRAAAVSGGLSKLGVGRGDTVAIMLINRPEFHIVDVGAMQLGATAFSIYATSSPEQIEYVVSDAQARVIFTEPAFLDRVLAIKDSTPLEHIVVVDGEAPDGGMTLAELEESGQGFDVESSVAAVEPDDLVTLIYTSGTTGPPKGVQLSNKNLMTATRGIEQLITFPDDARIISWLPAAHVAERVAHHYLPIVYGFQITSCPDPRQVVAYIADVHPTWFFAVPRIWEKLKAGLEAMIAGYPDEQREQAQQALGAAIQKVRLEQAGQEVPEQLAAAVAKADEAMFSKIRAQLGFDQISAVNVGAAPTPVEVLEFFHAIGIPIAELWGMSETCGAGTCNPPEKIKIGTVGPPTPGVEIKLAEDGEVLVRSDVVMAGYRNMPDKTAETIDPDGWLHTGDIGEIDDDGYLKIVDRKKELIISAAGKNMSPANIEAQVKASSPLIGQAVCIGDAKPYNTALIVLDPDFAPVFAQQQGIEDASMESLARDEKVRAAVQQGIDAANEKLARVEQIKKFHILTEDWVPGGDELTPTMKLKRKPIAEKYADEIASLYA